MDYIYQLNLDILVEKRATSALRFIAVEKVCILCILQIVCKKRELIFGACCSCNMIIK